MEVTVVRHVRSSATMELAVASILLLRMGIEMFQLFENDEENDVPWA